MISGLYAAIFMVFQYFLVMGVVKVRRAEKIGLGDGGSENLQRQIRAHGNFMEMVPFFLVLMVIAELSGAPFWALHVLAIGMVIGRFMHAYALIKAHGQARFYSMNITMFALFGAAGLCLWSSLQFILSGVLLG